MLYEDFGLSYRWIASRMAMSLRDVSRAVKGNAATKETIKSAKIDTDTIIKAIKLVREGKVRNPNDLVLELGLDLEQAKYLFNTIVENEKVTLLPIIEASQKVEKLWDDIMDHIYGFEELMEYYEKRGENVIKELRRALESADEQAKKTREEILSLQETLKALETRAKDAAKPLKRIQAIEEELQSFKKEIISKIATLNDKIAELENVKIAKINKDITTLQRGLHMLVHSTGNIIDCLFKLYIASIPPDKKAIIEELFQELAKG
jgi:chromosome segregation ATPase